MTATVQASDLRRALQLAAKCVAVKSSLPILEGCRIEVAKGALTLDATDLTTWVTVRMPAKGMLASCVAPFKALDDAALAGMGTMGAALGGEIALSYDAEAKTLTLNAAGRSTVPVTPGREFPKAPGTGKPKAWTSFDGAELRSALAYVLPAASWDDQRPHLACVAFDESVLVATDGHRLHLSPLDHYGPALTSMLARPSAAALFVMATKWPELRAQKVGDEYVVFEAGTDWAEVWLACKVPDGNFPPYRQVIPDPGQGVEFRVDPKAVSSAVRRVSRGVHRPKNGPEPGFVLEVADDGWLCALVDTPEKQAEEYVRIDRYSEQSQAIAALNAYYVIEALDGIGRNGDACTFEMAGVLDPTVVRGPTGRVAVIMPMRTHVDGVRPASKRHPPKAPAKLARVQPEPKPKRLAPVPDAVREPPALAAIAEPPALGCPDVCGTGPLCATGPGRGAGGGRMREVGRKAAA